MGDLEKRLKEKAKEMKHLMKRGVKVVGPPCKRGLKVVGDSCKKGWYKVRGLRENFKRSKGSTYGWFLPSLTAWQIQREIARIYIAI